MLPSHCIREVPVSVAPRTSLLEAKKKEWAAQADTTLSVRQRACPAASVCRVTRVAGQQPRTLCGLPRPQEAAGDDAVNAKLIVHSSQAA